MKGSFIKNCIVAFSGLKCNFILFAASILLFTFVGYERAYYWFASSMFIIPSIISVLEYNDRSRWELYSDTLPIGRGGSVGGFYLFILAYVAGLVVLSGIISVPLMFALPEMVTPKGLLMASIITPIVPLFFYGLCLPVFYRFGYKVFRTIMLICIGIVGGVWGFFIGFTEDEVLTEPNLNNMLVSNLPWLAAVLAAMVALYFLSMLLSKRIYKKVEL